MSRARPVGPSRVAVVVVNYNGRHHLDYCLPSILSTAYEAYEVIVVDNASTDGSAELVRSRFPRARLLASPTNRGWAGGNNLGIRQALTDGCSYVVLQNNDTLVDPRWLGAAVAVMDPNPRLGILGFRVLNEYRADEDTDRTVFQSAMDAWREPRLSATAHVSGCAMFVRARLFEELGLFDERYFYSFEDIEFCLRARRAGHRILLVPQALAYHEGHQSIGAASASRLYYAARNHLLLAQSAQPMIGPRALVRAAGIVALNLAYAVRGPNVPRLAALRAVSHGVADHLRGRYGPCSSP